MKKLESFDEYKNIIRDFRSVCRRPFSNVYYMPDDIKRYIALERAGYEKTESGIIFFYDEETYYKACLYVDEKEEFTIPPQKKRVLVRNVFEKEKKDEKLQCIENRLTESGFKKAGTSVAIQGESEKLSQRCKHMEKYAEALKKKGYYCVAADASMAEEIEALMLDSGIIKDYQLEYKSDEEKKRMINRGCYLCMVNRDNQVCAGGICDSKDGISQGVGVVVKEKYKMQGFAPVLAYYRCKWWDKNDIKLAHAWILTDNNPSLMYHRSLGYEFTNMYADEWILDIQY